jgi:hypothetical protein
MRLILSSLFMAVVALSCWAADISGKWIGRVELKLPDGGVADQPAWVELIQKRQELSGTAGGGDSDEASLIESGRFDGEKVEFQFTGPDGRVYKARLRPAGEDCLKGTLDFALPDGSSMTAKLELKRDKGR